MKVYQIEIGCHMGSPESKVDDRIFVSLDDAEQARMVMVEEAIKNHEKSIEGIPYYTDTRPKQKESLIRMYQKFIRREPNCHWVNKLTLVE